jgi:hypothetical protein
MGSEHQACLPVPISRIWIDAAREQISHDAGITPPNGLFPTDIHASDPREQIVLFLDRIGAKRTRHDSSFWEGMGWSLCAIAKSLGVHGKCHACTAVKVTLLWAIFSSL